jgi:hypothetical protein
MHTEKREDDKAEICNRPTPQHATLQLHPDYAELSVG